MKRFAGVLNSIRSEGIKYSIEEYVEENPNEIVLLNDELALLFEDKNQIYFCILQMSVLNIKIKNKPDRNSMDIPSFSLKSPHCN